VSTVSGSEQAVLRVSSIRPHKSQNRAFMVIRKTTNGNQKDIYDVSGIRTTDI